MATNQPVHGSAQAKEISVDLVAEGVDRSGAPNSVKVVASFDANAAFQLDVETPSEIASWRLDVQVVRRSIEVTRAFRDGAGAHDEEIPEWMDVVLGVVDEELEGGRA